MRLYDRCVLVEVLYCLVKYYVWSMALYGVEYCDSSESGSEIAGKLEMWCWRRVGKIICMDRVRNEEVLQTVKEEMNILRTRVLIGP